MANPKNPTWRIVAHHVTTGQHRQMTQSRDLGRLMIRLRRDRELWSSIGWQGFQLEDSSLRSVGYTKTLREHVASLHRQGQIDRDTYRRALACCAL